jgi:hypothetical protein
MRPPPRNWLDPRIEIGNSPIADRGMFATRPIKAGERVVVWGGAWGKDYTDRQGAARAAAAGRATMQWDEDLFSIEQGGDDTEYLINHSCDPNTWMADAFTLIARRDIRSGEELTADYALWEADESYVSRWSCRCGSPRCRGRVTGRDWEAFVERYGGHFSPLLEKRVRDAKRRRHRPRSD